MQPRKETNLLEGGTIVLTVEATGVNLRYFWSFNGKSLTNDTTATLTIRNATVANAGTYYCRILSDCGGVDSDSGMVLVTSDVNELAELGFTLMTPSPNPVVGSATIDFELARTRTVSLSVLDVLGREVLTPLNGLMDSGRHSVAIDCSTLPEGSYTVRLQSAQSLVTRRFVVVK